MGMDLTGITQCDKSIQMMKNPGDEALLNLASHLSQEGMSTEGAEATKAHNGQRVSDVSNSLPAADVATEELKDGDEMSEIDKTTESDSTSSLQSLGELFKPDLNHVTDPADRVRMRRALTNVYEVSTWMNKHSRQFKIDFLRAVERDAERMAGYEHKKGQELVSTCIAYQKSLHRKRIEITADKRPHDCDELDGPQNGKKAKLMDKKEELEELGEDPEVPMEVTLALKAIKKEAIQALVTEEEEGELEGLKTEEEIALSRSYNRMTVVMDRDYKPLLSVEAQIIAFRIVDHLDTMYHNPKKGPHYRAAKANFLKDCKKLTRIVAKYIAGPDHKAIAEDLIEAIFPIVHSSN